ncbi:MAG: HD domain-containing protein [Candidatus Aenigmarchaeota archaeon]|nr:HD domain-containing protein [Candidatus Aenigmarchaeota archaeon]
MKAMIGELRIGMQVDSLFSVKYKRAPVLYNPAKGGIGWRFAFGAADRTGEIEVSYWGGADEKGVRALHASFREGDIVRVKGMVGTWKDRPKIDVNEGMGSIEKAQPTDLSDFIPATTKDVGALYGELLALVAGVQHAGLKQLLEAFFLDPAFAAAFKKAPGAMTIHHAWLGGLLEHSLGVARIALAAARNYPGVDQDLVLAGSLLHDVGKMRELEVTTNIKIGEEGMLRGHTVLGEEMVREKAKGILDELTLLKLSHIILSHLGKNEHGAPKEPMFTEAAVVYYADELDSKANQFERIRTETTTEDFRVYDRWLHEVYLR